MIGGQEIKVELRKHLGEEGLLGLYKPLENKILVATHSSGVPMHSQQIEQTFWHEYSHCLFRACRKGELYVDEELVDLMGEFLYQSVGKKAKW